MKRFLIVLAVASAGCVHTEEKLALDAEKSREFCTGLGLKAGTEQFAQCVIIQSNTLAQRRSENSAALARVGQQLQAQEQAAWANRPIQTTCVRQGAFTNCSSY